MKGHELLNKDNLNQVREIPSLQQIDTDRIGTYIERIKKPLNGDKLELARTNERRIRLHTVGTDDHSTHYQEWLKGVEKILPDSKFQTFKELIGQPVPTLTLSETIFDELAKIFESSNPYQKLTFESDSPQKTQELKTYFDVDRFFREDVYETLKLAPNSFVVIDMKDTPTKGKPSPEPYFVNIESVIDCSIKRDGSTNYLIFRVDEKTVVAIDDTAYYVFDEVGQTYELREGYPSNHNLTDHLNQPYTPAFLIYPNFLNVTDNIVINSPLTKTLGALEWLLFWSVSKRYLDLYAPFPIYVSYEENCNYEAGGLSCEGGFLVSHSDNLEHPTQVTPCPKCSKQRLFGAGTEIEVPAPQTKEEPNLIEAVNVIPAEKNSIDYVTQEKVRLEQEIYYSILGKTSQPLETFSQSLAQLDLSTESRKAVLLHMKSLFERVHRKVLYTMARLRYGADFIDCYVNYGDNYFLSTSEQETKNYKELKNSGAPESMLHSNLERIIGTIYKTSPHVALLNQIYLEVEPFQTKSVEDVVKLYQGGLISKKDALKKIHFTDFIEQFESTHTAVVKMIELGEADKNEVIKQLKQNLSEFIEPIYSTIKKEIEQNEDRELKKVNLAKPASKEKRTYREEQE